MARITKRKIEGGWRITIPPPPEQCEECGRKLDGRMVDNPYGMWAVPTSWIKEGRRIVTCHVCHEGGEDAVRKYLPEGCKALEQLDRFLKGEK